MDHFLLESSDAGTVPPLDKQLSCYQAWIYLMHAGFTSQTSNTFVQRLKKKGKLDVMAIMNHVVHTLRQWVKHDNLSTITSQFSPAFVSTHSGITSALSNPNYLCTLVPQWLIVASHVLKLDLVTLLTDVQLAYPKMALSPTRQCLSSLGRVFAYHGTSTITFMNLTVACWMTVTEQLKEGGEKKSCMALTVGSHGWHPSSDHGDDTRFEIPLDTSQCVPARLRHDLSTPEFSCFEPDLAIGSMQNEIPLALLSRLSSTSFDLLTKNEYDHLDSSIVWQCGVTSGLTCGNMQRQGDLLRVDNPKYVFATSHDAGSLMWVQHGAFLIPVGMYICSDDKLAYGIAFEAIRQQLDAHCISATIDFPSWDTSLQRYMMELRYKHYYEQAVQIIKSAPEIALSSLAFSTPTTLDILPTCIVSALDPDDIGEETRQKWASYRISVDPTPGSLFKRC